MLRLAVFRIPPPRLGDRPLCEKSRTEFDKAHSAPCRLFPHPSNYRFEVLFAPRPALAVHQGGTLVAGAVRRDRNSQFGEQPFQLRPWPRADRSLLRPGLARLSVRRCSSWRTWRQAPPRSPHRRRSAPAPARCLRLPLRPWPRGPSVQEISDRCSVVFERWHGWSIVSQQD